MPTNNSRFLLVALQRVQQYSSTYFESIFTFQTSCRFSRLPTALAEKRSSLPVSGKQSIATGFYHPQVLPTLSPAPGGLTLILRTQRQPEPSPGCPQGLGRAFGHRQIKWQTVGDTRQRRHLSHGLSNPPAIDLKWPLSPSISHTKHTITPLRYQRNPRACPQKHSSSGPGPDPAGRGGGRGSLAASGK